MKKFSNWIKGLSITDKIALTVMAIIALVLMFLFLYKVFPYIMVCLLLLWYMWDNYKDSKEERMQKYIFEQSQMEAVVCSLYDEMTLSIYDTLKEFSNELGVKITNSSSITMPNQFYSMKYGFPIFRYRVRLISEHEYCLNDIRDLIQYRLDQQLSLDRIWIFSMSKKGNYLELLILWNNCKLSNDFVCFYEHRKRTKSNKDDTVPKDKDF